MDEEGFMTTKKEWESCSEEEEEVKPQEASKQELPSSVSNKSETSKPQSTKASGSQQSTGKKQASIMNFFAKKP